MIISPNRVKHAITVSGGKQQNNKKGANFDIELGNAEEDAAFWY